MFVFLRQGLIFAITSGLLNYPGIHVHELGLQVYNLFLWFKDGRKSRQISPHKH